MTYTSAKDFLTLDKTTPKDNGFSFGNFTNTLNGLQTAKTGKDGASRLTGIVQAGKGIYEILQAFLG